MKESTTTPAFRARNRRSMAKIGWRGNTCSREECLRVWQAKEFRINHPLTVYTANGGFIGGGARRRLFRNRWIYNALRVMWQRLMRIAPSTGCLAWLDRAFRLWMTAETSIWTSRLNIICATIHQGRLWHGIYETFCIRVRDIRKVSLNFFRMVDVVVWDFLLLDLIFQFHIIFNPNNK